MPIRFARTRPWAAVALLPLAALVLACSEDSNNSPSEPTTPAGITGVITSTFTTGIARGVIRVEFSPSNANEGPKALVNVTPTTTIFLLNKEEGEFRNLATGIWVRVWFDGPVMESYPVQGTAGTIVIDSLGSTPMLRTP
jgi:hypothetical protein